MTSPSPLSVPCTVDSPGGVDSGSGSSRVLSRMRIPQGRIDAVFLTHFHSDHIDGLGELLLQRWANGGHETPVPIHGPQGVEGVVAGLDLKPGKHSIDVDGIFEDGSKLSDYYSGAEYVVKKGKVEVNSEFDTVLLAAK